MNFISLWQRNRLWFTLVVLTTIASFLLEKTHITRLNIAVVYTGIIFLVFTLLPNNLLKWPIVRTLPGQNTLSFLVRYRRNFGITAGVLFIIHSFINILNVFNFNPATEISFFLTNKVIAPGFFAYLIFIVLLITSTKLSYKLLGRFWKPLHRLVWFAVPLALVHGVLIKLSNENKISLPTVIGFGAVLVLVVMEGVALIRQRPMDPARRTHVWLTALGILAAVLWWFLA